MQNFLATVAQVSATLLGIFVAATIAYFVFLNEHVTTFSEQIESLKIDIGSELSRMNTAWPQPLEFFVPPQFRERYREKYPDKSESALISQLSTDLVFHLPELINVVRAASGSHMAEGRWEGRLYTFILTEIVRAIGGGVPAFPLTVFPASPGGPGFDQWRATFQQLRGSVELLRMFRTTMISSFEPYIREQPHENQTRKIINESADKLFSLIEQTQAKLDQIDKFSLARQRYLSDDAKI